MEGLKGDWNAGSNNHEPVYSKLRAALIDREFMPGEHLMIGELADRYGVSSTPVREALSRLREERLVAFTSGKGYSCPPPDVKELRDLYQTLGVLLTFAATAAIGRSAAHEVEQIAAAVEAGDDIDATPAETAEAARTRTAIVEDALQRIADLTGNQVLSRLAGNAIDRTHAVRLIDMECAESFRRFAEMLRGIARAVRRNDRESAAGFVSAAVDGKSGILPKLVREVVARHYVADADEPAWAESA